MKKKILFLSGVVLLSIFSCQKSKLYPALPTSVSSQNGAAFSTTARIQAQVFGLYAGLGNGQLYGGRYQVYNEVKAENWINATANSVTAYQTWGETVTSSSSEVINMWAQAYLVINNCNLFIDGMGAYGNATMSAAGLSTLAGNYIGEAQFIRAAAYYALLQMYCVPYSSASSPGLPLRLTGNSSFGNFSLAPSTVAQIYAQVIADLNSAENALPLTYLLSSGSADAVSDVSRASKNTAIALKTRVYLSMGQWSNVVTEANKIVSASAPFTATNGGVPYALQANIANVYKSPYTTTESVFSIAFATGSLTPGGQNSLADYFGTTGADEFYLNTASTLYTDPNWKATDARKAFLTLVSGKYHTTKWPSTGASLNLDWAPVIRYPEVLLNLAEARVNLNGANDPQAIALLNAVRQRSDPTTVFTTATLASIYEERNIEFLGEGFRWADLLRLGLPIPAKSAVLSVPVGGYGTSYIWPMSSNEELYNPLIGR